MKIPWNVQEKPIIAIVNFMALIYGHKFSMNYITVFFTTHEKSFSWPWNFFATTEKVFHGHEFFSSPWKTFFMALKSFRHQKVAFHGSLNIFHGPLNSQIFRIRYSWAMLPFSFSNIDVNGSKRLSPTPSVSNLSPSSYRYLSTLTRSLNQGSVDGFRRERLQRFATFDSLLVQRRLEAR